MVDDSCGMRHIQHMKYNRIKTIIIYFRIKVKSDLS